MFTQQQQIPRSPLASTLTLVVPRRPGAPRHRHHRGDSKRAEDRLTGVAHLHERRTAAGPQSPAAAAPSAAPLPPPPARSAEARAAKAGRNPIAKPIPPAPVPERKVPEPPREAPPLPKPPPVVVGAFADATPVARKPERAPDVVVAGFESASAQGVRTRKEVTAIEGFDTATSRPTGTRAGAVSDAGFGAAARRDATADDRRRYWCRRFWDRPDSDAGCGRAPSGAATSGFGETPAPVAPRRRAATAQASSRSPGRSDLQAGAGVHRRSTSPADRR